MFRGRQRKCMATSSFQTCIALDRTSRSSVSSDIYKGHAPSLSPSRSPAGVHNMMQHICLMNTYHICCMGFMMRRYQGRDCTLCALSDVLKLFTCPCLFTASSLSTSLILLWRVPSKQRMPHTASLSTNKMPQSDWSK